MKFSIKFTQTGSIFPLALITLTSVLVLTMVLVSNSFTLKESSKYSLNKLEVGVLAEAGIDKAIASLNVNPSYNGEVETFLGQGSYSVTITSIDSNNKIVEATGYIPNKTQAKTRQSLKIQVSKGEGISFPYGLQVGEGGLNMGNSAILNGSVYSNGDITVGNSANITGDVWVAGGTQPTADQSADCVSPNCTDYLFGKTVSGENRFDVAQSFQISQQAILNKISLKLKKFGSPPNITVRILGNNDNGTPSNPADDFPNKNNVKTSGTLSANLVTTSYGFVDVSFSSTPTLQSGTRYWIVLDTSGDTNNYWFFDMDTLQGYTSGFPKWSSNWQASNPLWTSISGDFGFKVYIGGVITKFVGGNSSTVNGDLHANTIQNVTINGDAYYQSISGSTVNGTSNPGSTDPPPEVFPISQTNIDGWKEEAEAGLDYGSLVYGNSCNVSLGPGKLEGNLTLGNSCTVTVTSPFWITGNIVAGNSLIMKLPQLAGSASGVILVDGTTTVGNGCENFGCGFMGSGTSGSYLMLLSTYDSTLGGSSAITAGNSSFSGIFYAPKGTITLGNSASFKEVSAWKIVTGNGAILSYEQGLSGVFFSAGPTGSFSVVKGTYQLK